MLQPYIKCKERRAKWNLIIIPKCVETIYPQPKLETIWLRHSPSSLIHQKLYENPLGIAPVWVRIPFPVLRNKITNLILGPVVQLVRTTCS